MLGADRGFLKMKETYQININQDVWPRIGRYIGHVNDYGKNWLYENRKRNKEVVDAQSRRVYGDEIQLATKRIDDVKYLVTCYEQGYHKDISWK